MRVVAPREGIVCVDPVTWPAINMEIWKVLNVLIQKEKDYWFKETLTRLVKLMEHRGTLLKTIPGMETVHSLRNVVMMKIEMVTKRRGPSPKKIANCFLECKYLEETILHHLHK